MSSGRLVACVASMLVVFSVPSLATSIIVEVKRNGILIVSDSLANEKKIGFATPKQLCKCALLGTRFAFTETGIEGYTPDGPLDLPEWHGLSEAVKAYDTSGSHDLFEVADKWGQSVELNFLNLYNSRYGRALVRESAARQKGLLLVGIFAGQGKDGHLATYNVVVSLDESKLIQPISYRFVSSPDGQPYSTNAITQELIDGKTDRALQTLTKWKKKKNGSAADFYEYLIRETMRYDPEVGGDVNVLKVTASRISWIHNSTCKHLVPANPKRPKRSAPAKMRSTFSGLVGGPPTSASQRFRGCPVIAAWAGVFVRRSRLSDWNSSHSLNA